MPKSELGPSQAERASFMVKLGEVAKSTGTSVLEMCRESIGDTVQVSGHQFSTVDERAKQCMREAADRLLPGISVKEESDIPIGIIDDKKLTFPVLIGDAVEGSTNAKRGLGSAFSPAFKRPILAGTSVMLLETRKLSSIAAAAFYDWNSGHLVSCFRGESGSFVPFFNRQLILTEQAQEQPRDSQIYAVVPGYSHSNITDRAAVETALQQNGIRAQSGSRSSAQDLLDLLWGSVDAYVDLRQLLPGSTDNRDEVLRAWDVGALLPLLDGLGFIITDHHYNSWQENSFSASLVLVAARQRDVWQRIMDAISHLHFVTPNEDDDSFCVPLPSSSLSQAE